MSYARVLPSIVIYIFIFYDDSLSLSSCGHMIPCPLAQKEFRKAVCDVKTSCRIWEKARHMDFGEPASGRCYLASVDLSDKSSRNTLAETERPTDPVTVY